VSSSNLTLLFIGTILSFTWTRVSLDYIRVLIKCINKILLLSKVAPIRE
jgi:hypothetical protein